MKGKTLMSVLYVPPPKATTKARQEYLEAQTVNFNGRKLVKRVTEIEATFELVDQVMHGAALTMMMLRERDWNTFKHYRDLEELVHLLRRDSTWIAHHLVDAVQRLDQLACEAEQRARRAECESAQARAVAEKAYAPPAESALNVDHFFGAWVYVIRDEQDDRVIYVGMSENVLSRLAQHRQRSWFPACPKVDLVKCEDRADAARVESELIISLKPEKNVVGVR